MCYFKNLQLSIYAELVEKTRLITWGIARNRQIRILHIALQPRRIRNCPDTPQGHNRLPTKLPCLPRIDLTPDGFSTIFFCFFRPNKSRPLLRLQACKCSILHHFFFSIFSPRDEDRVSSAYFSLLVVHCCRSYSRKLYRTAKAWSRGYKHLDLQCIVVGDSRW